MGDRVKNMTAGSPGRLILFFALPLMAGNICQTLYTMVDTAVVGRLVGLDALAALGVCDWFAFFMFGAVSGMTQGFSIRIAQDFGAGDIASLRKNAARSYVLTGVITALALAAAQVVMEPTLHLLNTPETSLPLARTYLRILFWGMPISAVYNILACHLRAVGNSRAPLYAMLTASLSNIALDVLFVGGFSWGVAGAAAATLIAQAIAALMCLAALRGIPQLRVSRADFRREAGRDWALLKLGAPIAIQNSVIAVGGMVVQAVVDRRGALFVAGYTATNKLYGLLEMAAISYGYALTTYVGQNLGAGQLKRIRQGVTSGFRMAMVTALSITALMIAFGRSILSLFISGTPEECELVLNVAYRCLTVMAALLFTLYLLYVYRSSLQGLGNTLLPMVSGGVEFCMRVGVALILPRLMGDEGLFFVEASAWVGAAILLAAGYYRQMRRVERAAAA